MVGPVNIPSTTPDDNGRHHEPYGFVTGFTRSFHVFFFFNHRLLGSYRVRKRFFEDEPVLVVRFFVDGCQRESPENGAGCRFSAPTTPLFLSFIHRHHFALLLLFVLYFFSFERFVTSPRWRPTSATRPAHLFLFLLLCVSFILFFVLRRTTLTALRSTGLCVCGVCVCVCTGFLCWTMVRLFVDSSFGRVCSTAPRLFVCFFLVLPFRLLISDHRKPEVRLWMRGPR